jgi:hypothetical protein
MNPKHVPAKRMHMGTRDLRAERAHLRDEECTHVAIEAFFVVCDRIGRSFLWGNKFGRWRRSAARRSRARHPKP